MEQLPPVDDAWLKQIADGMPYSAPRVDLWSLAQECQRARRVREGLETMIAACPNCQGRRSVLQVCIGGTETVPCHVCQPLVHLLDVMAGEQVDEEARAAVG